ncbi:ATP-dependent DNA ligase [Serratia phage 92A1]|nr:ATP-dependent DNA ligase [Serratia phage 92A1]
MIYDIIEQVATNRSSKKKEEILKEHKDNETLKRVFRLAYSRRINYGIKKWPEPIESRGIQTLETALDFLEFKLATRELSGNKAIEHLAMIISDLHSVDNGKSVEILRRVLNRDLECGAGRTIPNKIWKGILPEQPQFLAAPYSEKNIKKIKFPALAQLKADGARCFAELRDGKVTFFSRAGNEYLGLSKLKLEIEIYAEVSGIDNFMIDGELVYVPPKKQQGLDFLFGESEEEVNETVANRQVSNGIANKSLKGTISKEESDGMQFQVWDFIPLDLMYDETGTIKSAPYELRLQALECIATVITSLKVVPGELVKSLAEARIVYKKYIALGLEGIILKNLDGLWVNKRSTDQVKFKEVISWDLLVKDVYAHSKDPNKLGGITFVSACGKIEVDSGSGLKDTDYRNSDELDENDQYVRVYIPLSERDELDREYLWSIRDQLIGTVFEGTCNSWTTSKGRTDKVSLFLPIIKKRRFDKTQANTFEDIFGITFEEAMK